MINFIKKKSLLPYIALIFLNLLAHFLPFERSSPTNDEYHYLKEIYSMPIGDIYNVILHNPDRPLSMIYLDLMERLVNQNQLLSTMLMFLISSVFSLLVYFLMLTLLSNVSLAFLGALFHLILPNKLELFSGLDVTTTIMNYSLALVSVISFIYFIKIEKKRFLFLSLFTYTMAIFWYELHFFLPIALTCYAFLYGRKKMMSMAVTLLFWIPALCYAIFRFLGHYLFYAYGIVKTARGAQETGTIWHNIITEIPSNYVGYKMIQPILYGLYRFPTIELKWLFIISALDMVAFYGFIKWLKKTADFPENLKLIYFSIIIFIVFLMVNSFWTEVLGRHTALSSIGLVLICLFFLRFKIIQTHKVKIMASIFLFFLVVCQGVAWNQVVARRINHSLYQYLSKNKDEMLSADRIVINQYSFAKNISYDWSAFYEGRNLLDKFWGEQCLPWNSLEELVQVALGEKKPVFLVRSAAINIDNNMLNFKTLFVSDNIVDVTIPKQGSVIIDYDNVFGKKYYNGNVLP